MSDLTKYSDLFADDVVSNLAAEFEKVIPVIEAGIQKMANNLNASLSSIKPQNLADYQKQNELVQQATTLNDAHLKSAKLLAQVKASESTARTREINEKKAQIALDEKIIANKTKEENAVRKSQSAYAQLNAELVRNRQISKDLQAEIKLGNTLTNEQAIELGRATDETRKLDAQIKEIDYTVGNAQRNVGNYNGQLGTLAKGVKGFGALGRIFSRALGIDPEVFNGIREAGMALRDINHISEAAKLAKEGEAAANLENSAALNIETESQIEESAAAALSTGGMILLVAALVGAGVAIYNYITARKEQKEIDEIIFQAEKENAKLIEDRRKKDSENAKNDANNYLEKLVIQKKITEESKKQIEINGEASLSSQLRTNTEIKDLKDLQTQLGIQVDEYGKVLQKKQEYRKRFEDEPSGVDNQYAVPASDEEQEKYQNRLKAYNQEANKISQEAENDRNAISAIAANQREELANEKNKKAREKQDEELKRFLEQQSKFRDEELKAAAQTNVEKVDADYTFALREIELAKFTAQHKAELILELNAAYAVKIAEAKEKDSDVEFKRQTEENKKLSDLNAKQAEADFKLYEANISLQESKEIAAVQASKKTAEEKEKEILAIKLYYIDIDEQLHSDDLIRIAEDEKKKVELISNSTAKQIELAKQAAKERQKIEDELISGVEDGEKKKSELQQKSDDINIEFHKRTADIEAKLAAGGKQNTLAQEQAAATQAEEKKRQDAIKAAKVDEDIALAKAFLDTFNKALENGDGAGKALLEAGATEGALKIALSKLIAGYAEGTDSLTEDGAVKLGDGKDNLLIRATKGERMFGIEDSKKVEGYTNKELIHDALAFSDYTPQFKASNISTTQIVESSHDEKLAQIIDKKFSSLQTALENKPVSSIDKIGLMELISTVREGSMTRKTHHKIVRKSMRAHG